MFTHAHPHACMNSNSPEKVVATEGAGNGDEEVQAVLTVRQRHMRMAVWQACASATMTTTVSTHGQWQLNDDKDVQATLMVRQWCCGGRLNKGCWRDHPWQCDGKSTLGNDTRKCGGADNSDGGEGSASNVMKTTSMTMHDHNALMEYMGGQRVGNDDYLLMALNHSPENLMLLRCYLEGIHPQ